MDKHLEELWINVASLAQGRVCDNALNDKMEEPYPLDLRIQQTTALRFMIIEIEKKHEQMLIERSLT